MLHAMWRSAPIYAACGFFCSSHSWADAGAFEAELEGRVLEELRATYDGDFPDKAAEFSAKGLAGCVASYVIDGLLPGELDELDASASGGAPPSADTSALARRRIEEAYGVCRDGE